tara:strand:- start:150 stop:524 length:375 start_codon:yes stop_codon:yes gene_type:complete
MWIKLNNSLRTSPKLLLFASRMQVSKFTALGVLCHAWMIADDHATQKGLLEHLNFKDLDNMVGIENLAESMASVGWIEEVEEGIKFMDYESHNGSEAKVRAQAQKRQARRRTRLASEINDSSKS